MKGPGGISHPRADIVAPPGARVNLRWLVRISLCFCFLIAFTQYEVSSTLTGYVPLAVLLFCALLVLCGRQRTYRMQHILAGGGLVFAGMLFGEVVSYASNDRYSEIYGLVFIGLFLCIRLVVQEIGMPNVIRAYSQAAILTTCIVLISGRQTLFAGESSRFSGGTRAHPNLLGFVFAGFFPVLAWRALEEKTTWKKRALIGLSIVTLVVVFMTGSRGSLSAVLLAGAALLLRALAAGRLARIRVRHMHIVVLLIVLPLAVMFLLQHNRLGRTVDYVINFLALNTTQRGLKSGFSGRTGIWQIAFRLLRVHDRWLFGFGYRAGDRMVGTIDNGYVQLLFESGLIAGGLIMGSILRVFFLLWKASRGRVNNAWTRYYMMLWCLMIVYLLNNISARYLFSFGSPFSLCVLFLMAASERELIGEGSQAPVAETAASGRAASSGALVWNRSGP